MPGPGNTGTQLTGTFGQPRYRKARGQWEHDESQLRNGTQGAPSGGPRRRAAEIDVDEARKAFFLMVGFIAVIWVLQVANWADHYQPRRQLRDPAAQTSGRLGDIFTAPFLHFSWDHIEGNSGPLFVFGLLAAYRGVVKFLRRHGDRRGHQQPGGVAVPEQ